MLIFARFGSSDLLKRALFYDLFFEKEKRCEVFDLFFEENVYIAEGKHQKTPVLTGAF